MRYTGIPFEHNGRTTDGIDCLGLIKLYLDNHGLEIPGDDDRAIERDWHTREPGRLLRGLRNHMVEIDERPQEFDVLLFEMKGKLRHLGVMVSRNRFLHIRKGKRSSTERLSKWEKVLEHKFRHKELI